MPKIRYERLPYQSDFDESRKFYDVLCAGFGAGKTFALVMKLLRLAALNKGLDGGILAPTYKMFKRDVLPTFKDICGKAGLSFKWHSSEAYIWLPNFNSKIYVFHAEDDGLSIRGPNLAYGGVNEVTLVSEAAFKAFVGRIRVKEASLMQIAMSGTPEGFNWFYDMFIAESRPDADVFYGDMRQNIHIASSYADILMASYDDLMVQQFVEGKFINASRGSAFYKFDRMKHTATGITRNDELPIWVSLDFNVNPMAATLWNRYPDSAKDKIKLRGFDEVRLEGADTYDLADAIIEKAGGTENVIIFPDGIGGSQDRTSAKDNISDIEILEDRGFKDIRYKKSLSVRDCLNAANAFIGKNQLVLDSVKCKETVKDCEQVILKKGYTGKLDKSDLKRTHWVDGIKNMIDYEWPIEVGRASWKTLNVR